ncbi:GPI inositol-deacylase [Arthrobacter sp. Hiyo1]|uniref:GPI inositol-deacylase n=1 Tax=Arthrobacter sp. Hiyo1 TaxID=1588020 RepID=UPI001C0E91EF|nr:GPI inositol-deacylase [Arthrobacter sp. Hiyo1]
MGVHGIRQYKFHRDPRELQKLWAKALVRSAGLKEEEFALAYYAPILHLGARQGSGSDEQFSETECRLIAAWLVSQGTPVPVVQGPATRWLRDGIDWFIRNRAAEGLTQAIVASAFREVAVYVDPLHASRRHEARRTVAEVITKEKPRILIAHSLGSVVAYETLWAWPNLRVDLLLTLGSPLALPGIFADRLDPFEAGQRRKPPGVIRWVNVADEGDLIAVPKGLSQYFDGVDSDAEVTIGSIAFHDVEAYLRCSEVANILAAYDEGDA